MKRFVIVLFIFSSSMGNSQNRNSSYEFWDFLQKGDVNFFKEHYDGFDCLKQFWNQAQILRPDISNRLNKDLIWASDLTYLYEGAIYSRDLHVANKFGSLWLRALFWIWLESNCNDLSGKSEGILEMYSENAFIPFFDLYEEKCDDNLESVVMYNGELVKKINDTYHAVFERSKSLSQLGSGLNESLSSIGLRWCIVSVPVYNCIYPTGNGKCLSEKRNQLIEK